MNKLKIVSIFLIILLLSGCYVNSDNNSTNTQMEVDNNVEQSQLQKTYKTSSDEYRNYIDNLITNLNITDMFVLNSIKWSSPYVKVNYYENGSLDDDSFENEKNSIINTIYNKLKNNNYKSGGLFETSYEYISVGFYKNYGNNDYRLKTFEQIDVYDF